MVFTSAGIAVVAQSYKSDAYWQKFASIKDDVQSTGIIPLVTDSATDTIYNLRGNRIHSLQPGMNIIKKKDGTTIKKILK